MDRSTSLAVVREIVKVDKEMIDQMIATVEEHSEFTLSQINTDLQETLPNNPRVTDSTIS